MKDWWKQAVVYQIYPRSFKDGNGDGIGDLRGILEKVSYLKDLGIDAVWLNPIYQSPNCDGGYDISDYYSINPEFGTMADFDELVLEFHQNNIKLIMDIVVNHSSDEHKWFQESRKSKTNPYRDYYFWRPPVNGGPPNNWPSFFGGSAWKFDDATGEYYLHLFAEKQPDLNWENPSLREEIKNIIKFWMAKGVDGFRLDVISAISKRTDFPSTDTSDFNETIRRFYSNGPRLREFIRELRSDVFDNKNVMTVGEGPGISPENALSYLDEKNGLDMIFHFGHMFLDQGPGGRFDPIDWTMKDFKEIFLTWDKTFKTQGWNSVFLGNHDFARMVSRWGNDGEFWEQSAKLLLTLLLTMRGTPFIYMGDEIGMTNTQISSVDESEDIETINGWREAKAKGIRETEFLKKVNYAGRDNARTPMQWSDQPNAGFTSGKSWMLINKNYNSLNVESQRSLGNSILNYFRQLILLRKASTALFSGEFVPLITKAEELFVYQRKDKTVAFTVILNLSATPQSFDHSQGKVFGNYEDDLPNHLRPWEAKIIKV